MDKNAISRKYKSSAGYSIKRGLHPMLKYRRFSKQKNLLTDGSRKIKKKPKCTELSYLGKYRFLFLKKYFIFKKKKIK